MTRGVPSQYSCTTNLVLLAFLLASACLALPTLNVTQSSLGPSSNSSESDMIIPHCFFPGSHHLLRPTNLADCKAALRILVEEPGFRNTYRFSRNPRRGIQVPKGWRSGHCLIAISCENDFDADQFSYADVLKKAKVVVDQCVDVAEGEVPWGGVDNIGTVGSFSVSVSGLLEPHGTEPLVLTNVTLEA